MAMIKDISIASCICGVDTKSKIMRTGKQRAVTWMIVAATLGIAILALTGGFALKDWMDPKGLIALGLLAYCILGVGFKFYKRFIIQKKHKFLCSLRQSFYDIV